MGGDEYPEFDTIELKTRFEILLSRIKMNYTQLASESGVNKTTLSRILGGYKQFSQPAARTKLLRIIKVLLQKGGATKDEVDRLFELARNASPANEHIP